MAYLISEDTDEHVLHSMTHGIISRSDLNYFRDRMESGLRSAGEFASRYAKAAYEKVRDFDLSGLKDKVEAVRDRIGRRWARDAIETLTSLPDLQQAKPKMRRWLMANERARRLYYGDKISGFNDVFDKTEGEFFGNDLRDYRNVMQGAYVGDETEDRFITYMDVMTESETDDDILTHSERMIIRNAWERFEAELDIGQQDPSSPGKHLL